VGLGLAAWLFPTDQMVTIPSVFFFSFSGFVMLLLSFVCFALITFCIPSAPRRTICDPVVTASRNGFLWHTREYTSTNCNCRECPCCSGATFGKHWSIVDSYSHLFTWLASSWSVYDMSYLQARSFQYE